MKHKKRWILTGAAIFLVQYLLLFQPGTLKYAGAAALLIPAAYLVWRAGGRALHDTDFRKEVLLVFSGLLCLIHGCTNLLGACQHHSCGLALLGLYFLLLAAARTAIFQALRHKAEEDGKLKACAWRMGAASLLFLILSQSALHDLAHLVRQGSLRDVTVLYILYEITFGLAFLWENKKHRRRLYVACGCLSLSTVLVTGFSLLLADFQSFPAAKLCGLAVFVLLAGMAGHVARISAGPESPGQKAVR